MRTFVAIVDHGSLTAAAAALDRSLPAVVRTLASLERTLGAALLRRTTRRMSITAEGRDYLERCRRILADVEEAERSVGQAQIEPRGEIRMTAPVLFGQMHVAPGMIGFLDRYAEVSVELLLLDRVVNLVDEGIDLALRIDALADSSMVAIGIGHVRRVVCASPKRLRISGTPEHPSDLRAMPCLRFHRPGISSPWRFQERGRELGVSVSGSFCCNQSVAIAQACVDGVGFGQFLSYQVAPMVRSGQLDVVLEAFEPVPIPVSLVYPQARRVTTRARALLDWMKNSLGERLVQAQLPATA